MPVVGRGMEGAAVAQTCLIRGTPFAAMRNHLDRDDSAHGWDFCTDVAPW